MLTITRNMELNDTCILEVELHGLFWNVTTLNSENTEKYKTKALKNMCLIMSS